MKIFSRKLKEGPIISDKPRQQLRGLNFPQNDRRVGLPDPTPRRDVIWTRPQPTTSSDSGIQLSPETPNWSKPGQVKISQAPVGKYAATGQSPTTTGGFRGNTPSGTGLTKQVPGYVPSARPGDSDKRRVGRGIPKQ